MTSLNVRQRRAIDRQKERLVPAAEAMLEAAEVVRISRKKFGESQLRNLLAVASETESPAVVSNFIRYQIGRDNKRHAWARETGGLTLGERLIQELKTGAVNEAVKAVKTAEDFEEEAEQLARIELTRHFIGFASRYLKYLDLRRVD